MKDLKALSAFIEKILAITLITTLFLMIFPQQILPFFINTTKYINNSDTIELSAFEYIGGKGEEVGFGSFRDIITVKNNSTYYNIYYYAKNKYDSVSINPFGLGESGVYIPINPIEFKKHKGTLDDPISVFNYGFQPDEFKFDNRSYRYNIKAHIVRVEILHINDYENYLWFIAGFCSFIAIIRIIFFQKNRSS